MRRILFVATSNMFEKTGGGLANLAFYNCLEMEFPGRVDVIHMSVPKTQIVPSNFFLVPELATYEKLLSLLSGKIHRYNPWILNFLDKHLNEYSHCFINCGILGDLVCEIRKRGVKVAIIHHNYEVEFQMDNKTPPSFWGICPLIVRRNERIGYENADLNLFLTQKDRQTFEEVYRCSISNKNYVIGVFEPDKRELDNNESELCPNRIAICGSLNSVQTLCGIRDFATNYLDIIHNIYINDFLLKITGRSPGKFLQSLVTKDPNLRLIANPPIISDVIKDCGIFLCPTNVGGGIKLRIMDGLKLGMPILTHEISARGYDAFLDKPWFKIYKDKQSFEKGLKELILYIKSNRDIRQQIISEYISYFSFDSGRKRLVSAIYDFIN